MLASLMIERRLLNLGYKVFSNLGDPAQIGDKNSLPAAEISGLSM